MWLVRLEGFEPPTLGSVERGSFTLQPLTHMDFRPYHWPLRRLVAFSGYLVAAKCHGAETGQLVCRVSRTLPQLTLAQRQNLDLAKVSQSWLLRSPLFYCETASLHRAFTVIESILNLWPISLLVLASLPARLRPRTMGVRIPFSPLTGVCQRQTRLVKWRVWRLGGVGFGRR